MILMPEWITSLLSANSFASGGLIVLVGGAIIASLRNLPGRLWALATQHMMYELEITNSDTSFEWMEAWLTKRTEQKRLKRFRLLSKWVDRNDRVDERMEYTFNLTPGRGDHFFRHEGKWLWITCTSDSLVGTGGHVVEPRHMTIRCLRGSKGWMNRLVAQALTEWLGREQDLLKVYVNTDWEWTVLRRRVGRRSSSLVYHEGVFAALHKDVKDFLSQGEWYAKMGIPHRRGHLYYGPPGNGKTSLCEALASEFDMDVAALSLGGKEMHDDKLIRLLSLIPPSCILCIEDFDTVFDGRNNISGNQLSFTGVLNALDGFTASERRLVVVTTNRVEKLDPALVRPGRIDVKQYIGNATTEQVVQLFTKFFPEATSPAFQFATKAGNEVWSMAELQEHLLRYRDSAEQALIHLPDAPVRVALPVSTPIVKSQSDEADKKPGWESRYIFEQLGRRRIKPIPRLPKRR